MVCHKLSRPDRGSHVLYGKCKGLGVDITLLYYGSQSPVALGLVCPAQSALVGIGSVLSTGFNKKKLIPEHGGAPPEGTQ